MPRSGHARSEVVLSGLEVAALVEELDRRLRGSYVSNIFSLDHSQLLRMKNADTEQALVVSPQRGAWISERIKGHGLTGQFTTSLRQEIARAKLEGVAQVNLDRIFDFIFAIRGERRELVLEVVPPGNIILLDQARRVILALKEIRGPHRRVVRGETYNPPPQNRLLASEASEEKISQLLGQDSRVGRALGRGVALPRKYIDETLARAGMNQEDPSPPSAEKVRGLVAAMASLLAEARQRTIYLVGDAGTKDLMVVRPTKREILRSSTEVNPMVDELFEPLIREEAVEPTESDIRVAELEATLVKLRRDAAENDASASAAKELAARIQSMPPEDALALAGQDGKGLPEELRDRLKNENSSAAMASKLFDFAKERTAESQRIRSVEKAMEARKLREMKKRPKESAPVLQRRSKKEWYEKFRWFRTLEGKMAIGGRDAQSNTILIKRHLEEEDVVYHADLFGSPFFILKKGRSQTERESREVAEATVSFSSAWKTGLGAADAYWVLPNQVSSTAPTGEFLVRGSFMIRGKKNPVTRNLVQVSVGIDSDSRLVAGPEEAIAGTATTYLTLIPHREKASDTAKKVLAELRKLASGAELPFTVDDVLRALPAGGGKVVRRKATPKAY